MDDAPSGFRYVPLCSARGCGKPARYKAAAPWSDGTGAELKCYGLACDDHRDARLALARLHRQGLVLAEGETLGEVGLYQLGSGLRDVSRKRFPDHP